MDLVAYILKQPKYGRQVSVQRDAAGHGWVEIGGGLFGRPAEIGVSREQYAVLRYALSRKRRQAWNARALLRRAG